MPRSGRLPDKHKRPPAALGTCIRAQTACCAACHGSIPLDNGPVCGLASYIVGPRAHPAAGEWGRRPHQRIRRFESAIATICWTRTRDPTENLAVESRTQWAPCVSRPARQGAPDLSGQTLSIPDFYPGLVNTAPGNPFNNRQWLTRRPSTRHGDRPALGRSPMDKTPRRCG